MTDSILIVTVTLVEAKAVLQAFSAPARRSRFFLGSKTYYRLGEHGGAPVVMVQSEMGTATVGGALLTINQALDDLKPQAVIMCGIAFGLKPGPGKQSLGDILVSKQLLNYEPEKVDAKKGAIPRGDRVTASERLLGRCHDAELDWKKPKLHFGLVLSGEKLVNDPILSGKMRDTYPDAVGGEMEGAGLYTAARSCGVDWILVKAICDWADGEKNDQAQPLAANNAARYVRHMIHLGGWDFPVR